jgi:NAD(P)-dependent dehydrogenase (short-subunit alcohol dehydrogenase family)
MHANTTKRVAVATGGTGALGQWVVRALLEQGFSVHVPWIVAAEAEALAMRVGELSSELFLTEADVGSADGVTRYFGGVGAQAGRLDALCNLVGGFRTAPLGDTDAKLWEHMLRLNATTAFLCSRGALPLMKESGGGRIVNVAALPAVERGAAGMSAYAASKAALLNLTYSLARELRKEAITVNAIAPEILDTPENRRSMPDADTSRWVHPSEAARVISFLVGPDAASVTGSVLVLARG